MTPDSLPSDMKQLTEPGWCQVVVGDFAWFGQRCHEPASIVYSDDDGDWPICPEHAEAIRSA